jgi:hypothetical protein
VEEGIVTPSPSNRLRSAALLLALMGALVTSGSTCRADGSALLPTDTVIVANESDAAFCRDFAPSLARLSPQWIIVHEPRVPKAVFLKYVVIIGRPDSPNTGALIQGLMTPDQLARARGEDSAQVVPVLPWAETRGIQVCTGSA